MKNTHLFLLVLLSLSAQAQVRTGGGGAISPDAVIGSTSSLINFENQLIVSHLQCKGNGQEALQLGKNLPEIYSQLALIKSLEMAKQECAQRDAYFKCLGTKEFKKSLHAFKNDPAVAAVLKSKYKMTDKEVKNMVKFFERIEKLN